MHVSSEDDSGPTSIRAVPFKGPHQRNDPGMFPLQSLHNTCKGVPVETVRVYACMTTPSGVTLSGASSGGAPAGARACPRSFLRFTCVRWFRVPCAQLPLRAACPWSGDIPAHHADFPKPFSNGHACERRFSVLFLLNCKRTFDDLFPSYGVLFWVFQQQDRANREGGVLIERADDPSVTHVLALPPELSTTEKDTVVRRLSCRDTRPQRVGSISGRLMYPRKPTCPGTHVAAEGCGVALLTSRHRLRGVRGYFFLLHWSVSTRLSPVFTSIRGRKGFLA